MFISIDTAIFLVDALSYDTKLNLEELYLKVIMFASNFETKAFKINFTINVVT